MRWTFWLRVDFVPAALFFCLSSTNLIRINKMNEAFLFNKHSAAFTVSPVVLRIRLPFFFKHIPCGYSAPQNWAGSGPRVVMFCPVLFLQEHNDLHWFYYFSTWSIIHFSTLWHKPNYRDRNLLFPCAAMHHYERSLLWCCHSEQLRNGEQMLRLLCRWMSMTLIRSCKPAKNESTFSSGWVFLQSCLLPSWHAWCFLTCILDSKAHDL